jgi:hypothetical protein
MLREQAQPQLSVFPGRSVTTREGVNELVAAVSAAVGKRAHELARDLDHVVSREAQLCDSAVVPDRGEALPRAADIRSIGAAMTADTEFDPASARQAGVALARRKIELSSVMEAYRFAFRRLREIATDEAAQRRQIGREAMRGLMAKLDSTEDRFMAAIVAGYRDEHRRLGLDEEALRDRLIDPLLHGRILDDCSVWTIASELRLPKVGPYVVIAAEVRQVGEDALPGIESKLPSLDVFSAWRLMPDLQVGIVHVKSDLHLKRALDLISRMTAARVGVSARFDDLRDVPHAFHVAKVTLLGRAEDTSRLAVFDGSMLATAAVSAPDVMLKMTQAALGCFKELPDHEQKILFDTFRAWQDNEGCVSAAAARLYCHPNTVRRRLDRIERRCGLSLSRPKDLAELCLAFEVHRRLM